MPLFKLLSTDGSYRSEEIEATSADEVYVLVPLLHCREADVLEEGVYHCSLRIGDNGQWETFQRNHVTSW